MTFTRTSVLLLCLWPCLLQAGKQPSDKRTQQLKSLSLEQLGNIEVTTQSKEPTQVWNTPAAIYVLTGDDIRRSGATSIPDALRLIPGVNVARVNGSRNWAVGIRGFADQFSKYVLVLIDGRSVYTPLFGGILWPIDNVMLEDVDRIEVIRGPGGTIWGADAVNGIINIITKHSQETRGTLLSSGGGNADQNTEDFRYGSEHSGWTWRGNAFGFVRSPEYHVERQPDYDWSRDGQIGFRTDHAATKGGLNQLVRVMAREWAARGVTVNAIAPGYIETDLTKDHLDKNGNRAALERLVPAQRLGVPEEVADAVTFLASDRARFITGQVLYVDGGRVLV